MELDDQIQQLLRRRRIRNLDALSPSAEDPRVS
jgi:hypothetical protein